jgi:hypothetical protein
MLISNARNSLLGYLSRSDSEVMAKCLEPVDLPKDFTLTVFDEPITYHYFLESWRRFDGRRVASRQESRDRTRGSRGHGTVCGHPRIGPAAI